MPDPEHIRCIVIDPQERTIEEAHCPPEESGDVSLDWLKDKLSGGWVETTPRYFDGEQSIVVIDEEGRMKALQPFILLTDQGPEDFCGVAMLFGNVDAGRFTSLPKEITVDSILMRINWLAPDAIPVPGSFKLTILGDTKYRCKIVVKDSFFYIAVWSELFCIDSSMIDPCDNTRYTSPVAYHTVTPEQIGLLEKSMDPIFKPGEVSPQGFQQAREYMDRVRRRTARALNIKEDMLFEVPMSDE